MQPVPPPSPALLAKQATTRPVRPRRPHWQATLIICSSLAATALLTLALAGPGTQVGIFWTSLPVALLFSARVVAAVVPPAGAVLPRPIASLPKSAAAIVAILALTWSVHVHSIEWRDLHLWICLGRGLGAAVIPALLAATTLHSLILDPRVLPELLGAITALSGLVLLATCTNGNLLHLLAAHGGALILLSFLSLLPLRLRPHP
jgi:hypothetical protein